MGFATDIHGSYRLFVIHCTFPKAQPAGTSFPLFSETSQRPLDGLAPNLVQTFMVPRR